MYLEKGDLEWQTSSNVLTAPLLDVNVTYLKLELKLMLVLVFLPVQTIWEEGFTLLKVQININIFC